MKNIKYIDIGNMSPHEVDVYMDKILFNYKNIPYKRTSKIKKWIYNLVDTIGIAGSWGLGQ